MPKSLSFLDRSPRILGVFGLIVIVTGALLSLMLQGGLLTPTYGVTGVFTDAAGIRPGDRVTVAGLPAGEVEELAIERGEVHVVMSVNRDVPLPRDSRAEIIIETLLGRRSVALHPGGSLRELEDGGVIPASRTTTPVDIIELNDISVDLLDGSDAEAFDAFLGDLAEITEGKEEDVRTLITGLRKVTTAVDSRKEELERLLTSLRVLAETLGDRDTHVAGLIDNLDVVLDNLARRQDELRVLLESTASSSGETADLVRRNRTTLDRLLAALHTDLRVIDDHQLDLAATIAYLEKAVQGYSSVGYSQGQPNDWANIFVQQLGPAGVDALVGKCGVVDRFFDELFGADCETLPDSTSTAAPASRETEGGPEIEAPLDVPAGLPEPALPCGLRDLVGSTVGDPESAWRCGG